MDTTKRMNTGTITRRRKATKASVFDLCSVLVEFFFVNSQFFTILFVLLKNIKKSGGKHGHKKYHKKGSKTTGFKAHHNKDDFHKEKKFWDSEEKKGDHKKYGSEQIIRKVHCDCSCII